MAASLAQSAVRESSPPIIAEQVDYRNTYHAGADALAQALALTGEDRDRQLLTAQVHANDLLLGGPDDETMLSPLDRQKQMSLGYLLHADVAFHRGRLLPPDLRTDGASLYYLDARNYLAQAFEALAGTDAWLERYHIAAKQLAVEQQLSSLSGVPRSVLRAGYARLRQHIPSFQIV